jgi:hypothetical protein
MDRLMKGRGKDIVDDPSMPPPMTPAPFALGATSSYQPPPSLRLSTSSSSDNLSAIRGPITDKDGARSGSMIDDGNTSTIGAPTRASVATQGRGIGLIPAPLVSPSLTTEVASGGASSTADFDASLMSAFGLKRKTRNTASGQHVVEERLLRLMKSGMIVWLYDNSDSPSRRPAFLWLDARQGGQLGAICWTEDFEEKPLLTSSDPMIQAGLSPHRQIPLHDLHDIYIGMLAQVFETGLGHLAHEDRAFSLLTSDDVINVESPSAELRQQWISGIYQILGTVHKHIRLVDEEVVPDMVVASTGRPLLKQWCTVVDPTIAVEPEFDIKSPRGGPQPDRWGKGSSPPASPEAEEPAPLPDIPPEQAARILQRMFTFTSFSPHLTECPLIQSIAFLYLYPTMIIIDGIEFHRYSMNPAENNTAVSMFYSENDACLYWCGKGERKKLLHNSIRVSSITDIYLGHQRAIFAQNNVFDKNTCISIVSQNENKSIDLECASRAELKLLLAAINYILAAGGKPVQVQTKAGVAVKDVVKEHMDIMAKGGEDATKQAIAALVQGLDLTIFDEGSGIPFSREVHLFYRRSCNIPLFCHIHCDKCRLVFVCCCNTDDDKGHDSPGKLFWCDLGLREELAAHSLALEVITDVFIGKQTNLLKSPVAVDVILHSLSHRFSLSHGEMCIRSMVCNRRKCHDALH